MARTDNTGNKQAHKFIKGQSGNPNGRPKGALNKSTRMALELLNNDLEAITQALIDEAKQGNLQAIKLVFDKLIPNAKETTLPAIKTDTLTRKSLFSYVCTLLQAGELTASELKALTELLTTVDNQTSKNLYSLFD